MATSFAKSFFRFFSPQKTHGDPLELGLPNVILIGAQKAGTSNFILNLQGDRAVELPSNDVLEVNFFDLEWVRARGEGGGGATRDKLLSLYRSKWGGGAVERDRARAVRRVRFEKTPAYLLDHHVPYRMAELYGPRHLGGLQVLAILRDPVARELSAIQMYARGLPAGENRTDDEARELALAEMRRALAGAIEQSKSTSPRPLWAAGGGIQCTNRGVEGLVFGFGMYVNQIAEYLCAGFEPQQIALVPYSALRSLPPSRYGDLVRAVAGRRALNMPRKGNMVKVGSRRRVAVPRRGSKGGRGQRGGRSEVEVPAHMMHLTRDNLSDRIPEDLRRELDDFFAPYNQRLSELLAWAERRAPPGFLLPLGRLDPFRF